MIALARTNGSNDPTTPRRPLWRGSVLAAALAAAWLAAGGGAAAGAEPTRADVVVVGATPGGIMAAVAAARAGHSAVLLERGEHVGGLPANGLGATDIGTRGATGGLFLEFVGRVRRHYVETYGADSPQVRDCSDGYHFEPHVAEQVFEALLAERRDRLRVLRGRQFDAEPGNVRIEGGRLAAIDVRNLDSDAVERYEARVFIDATYEGDLAAAAGCEFRVGREGRDEYGEAMAGRLYKRWRGDPGPGSTGQADNAIQAFNYRLCLTRQPEDRVAPTRPEHFDREEFLSLAADIREGRTTGEPRTGVIAEIRFWNSIGRVLNPVVLPNGKVDANNQHLNFLSSDLPEENWPWPTSSWAWRDRFARRLREYTLGLLWFAQNDPEMPADVRQRCREWGLARSEFADNGHFPRQVYVREGRRVVGEYWFTARDAVPTRAGGRPPIHAESITASHYALDSHAVRKREPGRVHLDGFFSAPSRPYTVPYGVIVPKKVEGLLTPVPVSGSHVGFSTLRMEPCWMALGEAAGEAAALAIEQKCPPRRVPVADLQRRLLAQGAVLMYYSDLKPGDPHFAAAQFLAVRGYLGDAWNARLDAPVTAADAQRWCERAAIPVPSAFEAGRTSRGELLSLVDAALRKLPPDKAER
jgi:hypothetical protein